MVDPAYDVCCMRGMIRRLPLLIALVASLLALEPLLHQHPLTTNADAAAAATAGCVICAAGVNRLPDSAPAVVAPQVVAYDLVATVSVSPTQGVAISLASRAPPAA